MPTAPGAHPHFNDRGALQWHTSLADGLAAAKAERKKVLIEFGRACLNTHEKGRFLHGTSGGRSAAELLDDIEQVAPGT